MRCDSQQPVPAGGCKEYGEPGSFFPSIRSGGQGSKKGTPGIHMEHFAMKPLLAPRYAALLACAGMALATPSFAQDKTVKIGVLNDMSSLYADIGGPNSVAAI